MATVVEKFVVALGLEAKEFDQELKKTTQNIADAQQGATNAKNSINQSVENHAKATKDGLKQANQESAKLQNSLKETSKSFDNLSTQWLSRVKVLATGLIAPVAMMFSVGKAFNNYFSEAGQVAKMTGQHSERLEEWRKKRAMLNRVTQEDIQLYKKSRESLLSFNIVMGDLGAMITRSQAPAIKFLLGLLDKFTKWVDANKVNIVRFIKVLTTSILVMLIPAFVKLGVAMLANPITLIIALIGSLIFIIDDLVTYMNGGKSAFSDFWKEVVPLIQDVIKVTKFLYEKFVELQVAQRALEFLKAGFKAIGNAILFVVNLIKMLVGIVTGDVELMGEAWQGLGDSVINIFTNLGKMLSTTFGLIFDALGLMSSKFVDAKNIIVNSFNTVLNLFKTIGEAIVSIGDTIKNAFSVDNIVGKFKSGIASLIDSVPDFMKTDSMKEFVLNTKQANDNANQADKIATTNQSNVNNSNKSLNQTNNITINTNSDDPHSIASAVEQAQNGYNYDDLVYSSANGQTM